MVDITWEETDLIKQYADERKNISRDKSRKEFLLLSQDGSLVSQFNKQGLLNLYVELCDLLDKDYIQEELVSHDPNTNYISKPHIPQDGRCSFCLDKSESIFTIFATINIGVDEVYPSIVSGSENANICRDCVGQIHTRAEEIIGQNKGILLSMKI